jgi:hypothetical protein
MNRIQKPKYNEEYRIFEFRRPDGHGQLATGETIVSSQVLCANSETGADATAEMIDQVTTSNGTALRYLLRGGTVGSTYCIEFRIVTSNNQHLSDILVVTVY